MMRLIIAYKLQLPVIKTDTSKWWRENKLTYSILSLIEIDFLSIAPTSASSARTFSLAGQMAKKKSFVLLHSI